MRQARVPQGYGQLRGLFHPRGVAIVGASPDPSRGGGQPVRALLDHGYRGAVYPVNPKYREIGGVRCYRSLREIEGPCDLVVYALSASAVIDTLEECALQRIPYAVIYGSGFREAGEAGREREHKLRELAHQAGVRLIGPNCLGVVNVTDRVYAAFGSMTRKPLLAPGAVSVVSQSGGFGVSLVLRCAVAGAGFRYVVASGNETDITTPELIDYYLDDPQTRIVLAYVEGVADGRALMAAGDKAARLGKPILLWKGGRREQGLRAAATHTASMTGSYDIYRAALAQCGIIEVRSMEEAADLTCALACERPATGRRIGLVGGSGGSAIVFADACDDEQLIIPPLSPANAAAIREILPDAAERANPLDFAAGFLNDALAPRFEAALTRMLADDNIDQLCVMLATVQGSQALNGARILARMAATCDKPIMVFSSVPAETMTEALAVLRQARIPVLPSPTRVARVASVCAWHQAMVRRSGSPVASSARIVAGQHPGNGRISLNELESKTLLAAHGIAISRDLTIAPGDPVPEGAVAYPVAVKVVSRGLPHKSDSGAVELNIGNLMALQTACHGVVTRARHHAPSAKIDAILISEMIVDGLEMMVGAINDEVFGPTVLLSMGGIHAEVLDEKSYRVAPFDTHVAFDMIAELHGASILSGRRGAPPYDVEALAAAVAAVSRLAWEMRDRLLELDINPLFVRPAGLGVVAADALAVVAA